MLGQDLQIHSVALSDVMSLVSRSRRISRTSVQRKGGIGMFLRWVQISPTLVSSLSQWHGANLLTPYVIAAQRSGRRRCQLLQL